MSARRRQWLRRLLPICANRVQWFFVCVCPATDARPGKQRILDHPPILVEDMLYRWKTFLYGFVIIAIAVAVSSCFQDSPPDSAVVLPPTWTPTAVPVSDLAISPELPTPEATSQPTPTAGTAEPTETVLRIIQETPASSHGNADSLRASCHASASHHACCSKKRPDR